MNVVFELQSEHHYCLEVVVVSDRHQVHPLPCARFDQVGAAFEFVQFFEFFEPEVVVVSYELILGHLVSSKVAIHSYSFVPAFWFYLLKATLGSIVVKMNCRAIKCRCIRGSAVGGRGRDYYFGLQLLRAHQVFEDRRVIFVNH